MGNIFEKPKEPIKKQKKTKKTSKRKLIKKKSTKKQKGGDENVDKAKSLFELMKRHQDGWDVLSKQKPVATLETGDQSWFKTPFYQLSERSKELFLKLIEDNIREKYRYDCRVQILPDRPNENRNRQLFFYIPEYFNTACRLIGCTPDEGKEYVFNPFSRGVNKSLFINLVFGDYYKPRFLSPDEKDQLRPLLRDYNSSVGLPDPNSHELERYTKIY